jgi:NAD(P)-dependent dehydrogenase (short-subunit alcohol dehydrogenase family)
MAGGAEYVAPKHGVVSLTKSAVIDHAQTGLRIHAVAPGHVDKPLLKYRTADERQSIAQIHPIEKKKTSENRGGRSILLSAGSSFVIGQSYQLEDGYSPH